MKSTEIREVRKALGLTQAQFGSLLDVHGVTVCRWEQGHQQPTAYQVGILQHFARAAYRRQPQVRREISEVLITAGVMAGLVLLLRWATDQQDSPQPAVQKEAHYGEAKPIV